MRDVFYTLLVVWIIWRIMNSINTVRSKTTNQSGPTSRKTGETTVDYITPKKTTIKDDEGEYVDYEEIK